MHRIWKFICQPQYSYGNPPDFLFYGLKTYSFQRMNLGKLYPPRTSQQVLSAPFGKSETISARLLLHCW